MKTTHDALTAGETTGDEIKDFLAWLWPGEYETPLPHYRALAERLRGKKGEFVLMIERRESSGGGCMPELGPGVSETFSLGVLTDDQLRLERVGEGAFRGKLSFPTACHAISAGSHWQREGLQDGDMRPEFYGTTFFAVTEKPMEFRHRDGGGCFGSGGMGPEFCIGAERDKPMTKLEFHVGNAEIDAWCRRGAMHYRKEKPNERRCEMLSKLARKLKASINAITAIAGADSDLRDRILKVLTKNAEDLRVAMAELRGEQEPEKPYELVRRIRGACKEIRRLLDEAESLEMKGALVKRLRDEHPSRPAK